MANVAYACNADRRLPDLCQLGDAIHQFQFRSTNFTAPFHSTNFTSPAWHNPKDCSGYPPVLDVR
jgi:hypothetical protein